MKKLYFLDEEEKQRILSIHESATKRQYLSEQPMVKPSNVAYVKEKNWQTLYSCVPSQGKKPTKLSDGTTSYIINGITYYNNGTKKLADGKVANYDCKTEFKNNTEDKKKKLQQYKQQIINKTNENTKAIQKLLGLPETGLMDSALLQKINEKLNGGGQLVKTNTPVTGNQTKGK